MPTLLSLQLTLRVDFSKKCCFTIKYFLSKAIVVKLELVLNNPSLKYHTKYSRSMLFITQIQNYLQMLASYNKYEFIMFLGIFC